MPSRQSINDNTSYDPIDQDWVCGRCHKTVSSSDYYAYGDNCTCLESSTYNFGGGTQLLQAEQSMYHYSTTAILYQPRSEASSAVSIKQGAEGPEREIPNLEPNGPDNKNNCYLTLAPQPGLNEAQHQRSESFRSEMSYQMRRYLIEQQEQEFPQQHAYPNSPAYNTEHNLPLPTPSSLGNKFLPQDVYVRRPTAKGSGKTKSWQSSGSGGSAENALELWECSPTDPVLGIGAWVAEGDEVGLGIYMDGGWGGYPMNMSGITEVLGGVERR